jgi:hypothetical protein
LGRIEKADVCEWHLADMTTAFRGKADIAVGGTRHAGGASPRRAMPMK